MGRNAASLTDAFTGYADGNLSTASANWADLVAAQKVQVSTNRFAGQTSGILAPARWAGTSIGSNNQWASAAITGTDGSSTSYGAGVIWRCTSDTEGARDFYYAYVLRNNTIIFGKFVNGTDTVIANTDSTTFINGHRIDGEAEGTTIRVCVDGTAIGGAYTVANESDASGALASGTVGVIGLGDPGLTFGDNWEAGTMASTGQISGRGGIALSTISAINGITKSGISAINGLTI